MPDPLEPPRLFPAFRCKDPDAMIRWLRDRLGFAERAVYRNEDGAVIHAEMAFGSSIVMFGQARDDEHARLVGALGQPSGHSFYLVVDDPDALHGSLEAAAVEIITPLHDTEYGSRDFACRGPEGLVWSFGTYWPKSTEAAG